MFTLKEKIKEVLNAREANGIKKEELLSLTGVTEAILTQATKELNRGHEIMIINDMREWGKQKVTYVVIEYFKYYKF